MGARCIFRVLGVSFNNNDELQSCTRNIITDIASFLSFSDPSNVSCSSVTWLNVAGTSTSGLRSASEVNGEDLL